MTIPKHLLEKIDPLNNLPTLPVIASSLMAKINDPFSSAKDISDIITNDTSLSAKLLRLANSAFYGMPRTVSNIQEAVVLLGYQVINTLVLSLTVFDLFPDTRHAVLFDRKAFWKHCVLTGGIAKYIATKACPRSVDPNDAFCAGLLHDIGKIVMEQYLHEDLFNALIYSINSRISAFESEQTVLGYTHYHVSELLIQNWNLPDQLFYPIVFHHSPQTMDILDKKINEHAFLNTWICHLADYLSYSEQLTPRKKNEIRIAPSLSQKGIEILGLEDTWDSLPKKLEKLGLKNAAKMIDI